MQRTMYNHILSTRASRHRGICIFHTCLPLALSCLFGTGKNNVVLYVGLGMENHGKYRRNLFIPMIRRIMLCYVNLFIPSQIELEKEEGGGVFKDSFLQETNSPE